MVLKGLEVLVVSGVVVVKGDDEWRVRGLRSRARSVSGREEWHGTVPKGISYTTLFYTTLFFSSFLHIINLFMVFINSSARVWR